MKTEQAGLYTRARNEHARLYERKRLDVEDDYDLDSLVATNADPALALDLKKAFGLLPGSLRDALLLQVLGGLSSAEIAAAGDVSVEAIDMRLSRARKALRALIEGAPESNRKPKARP